MPNENDERYEGTFETFSTQGYNAGDKFDLDVTWEGNLPPSSGKLLTRDQEYMEPVVTKNSKSRQTLSTLSVTSAL